MQRFTYKLNEKNRDDLLQYNGISREEKCDTSRFLDDSNRAEVKQRRRRQ